MFYLSKAAIQALFFLSYCKLFAKILKQKFQKASICHITNLVLKAVNSQNICLPAILMLLLGIYWSNLSCSGAAMKIWAPPFWQSGSCLIENEAGLHVNICLTVSNLAYVEKKARGRLMAPACLSTCSKMVSAFFGGELLGSPWEGGCAYMYYSVRHLKIATQ